MERPPSVTVLNDVSRKRSLYLRSGQGEQAKIVLYPLFVLGGPAESSGYRGSWRTIESSLLLLVC